MGSSAVEVVVDVVVVVVVVVAMGVTGRDETGGVPGAVVEAAVVLVLLDDDNPSARMAACKRALCGRLEGTGVPVVVVGDVVVGVGVAVVEVVRVAA